MLDRVAPMLAAVGVLAASAAYGQAAPLAPIEQVALSRDAFSTGLLDRDAGALGSDLWRGADAQSLFLLLRMAPARPSSPAVGALMRRVLLSSGDGPQGATAALGGAKLKALARAGFIDEARQVESLAAGANTDPASLEAMAIADILSGDTTAGCGRARRVTAGLDNDFWIRLRVVCYAASNELDAAELALGILRENGRLGEIDDALLSPLASGVKLKAPVAPVDAVHFAALKAMGVPVGGGFPKGADGGVVKAVAKDESVDWPTRLAAAREAVALGIMSGAELQSIYGAAPAEAVGRYREIRAMSAPELLRDRLGVVASEIAAATDFDSLFALSALYSDEIRDAEGALVPSREAQSLALARLAQGDAVGAERWLSSAAAEIARGVPDEQAMDFIDLVGILGELEPAGAQRVAAAANVAVAPPRVEPASAAAAPSVDLAPVVAAAIDAARQESTGQAALAALAASGAAANGDPIAAAVLGPALRAAGLSDIVRRRAVEAAIAAMYPGAPAPGAAIAITPATAPATGPDALKPRLKPKRSA